MVSPFDDGVLHLGATSHQTSGTKATLGQVAARCQRIFRHVFFHEFLQAGDHTAMRVLDVEIQRTRNRVGPVCDGVEVRLDAVELDTFQRVEVFNTKE